MSFYTDRWWDQIEMGRWRNRGSQQATTGVTSTFFLSICFVIFYSQKIFCEIEFEWLSFSIFFVSDSYVTMVSSFLTHIGFVVAFGAI